MKIFYEFGLKQINKKREELCGDSVEYSAGPDVSTLVFSDGLGSGVKANILSTLTTRIATRMLEEGLPIDDVLDRRPLLLQKRLQQLPRPPLRQWQQLLHGNRLSHSYTDSLPDFVKLAEAHGVPGRLVTKPEEVANAIKFARETPGPVLLEFRVEKEEAVFPMVPAGAALDDMLRRPVRAVEKE